MIISSQRDKETKMDNYGMQKGANKMKQETTIAVVHESPLGCAFWLKVTFTLGLYLVWWKAKSLTITNKRVIWRTGVLSSNERSIPLPRITDISVQQAPLGKLLGYGDITIESASGPGAEITANKLANPNAVRDHIIEAST